MASVPSGDPVVFQRKLAQDAAWLPPSQDALTIEDKLKGTD
jgi:hypothetical protein